MWLVSWTTANWWHKVSRNLCSKRDFFGGYTSFLSTSYELGAWVFLFLFSCVLLEKACLRNLQVVKTFGNLVARILCLDDSKSYVFSCPTKALQSVYLVTLIHFLKFCTFSLPNSGPALSDCTGCLSSSVGMQSIKDCPVSTVLLECSLDQSHSGPCTLGGNVG